MKRIVHLRLEVARTSLKALDLAQVVVRLGAPRLLADGLVAAVMARGAVLAAAYHVEATLDRIADRSFAAQAAEKATILQHRADAKERMIRGRLYRSRAAPSAGDTDPHP